MKKFFLQNKEVVSSLVATSSMLLVSIVLSFIYDKFDFHLLVLSFVLIFIMIVINTIVVSYMTKDKFSSRIEGYLSLMKKIQDDSASASWLFQKTKLSNMSETVIANQ